MSIVITGEQILEAIGLIGLFILVGIALWRLL